MQNKFLRGAALFALATIGFAGVSQAAPKTELKNSAPNFSDGDAKFKLRGRFQYDVNAGSVDFDTSGDYNFTSTYVRRAFIGFQGQFNKQWKYKVDFVINPGASGVSSAKSGANVTSVGGGDGDVAVDDAYLEYAGKHFSLLIGEHNVTSPLEDKTSSLDIQFNERSALINGLGYGRRAGLGIVTEGESWTLAAAFQGDSLNNAESSTGQESYAASARGTWAPIFSTSPSGTTLVHLGAHYRYRNGGDNGTDGVSATSIKLKPALSRSSDLLAPSVPKSENDTAYGFELAAQWRSLGIQSEWAQLSTSGDATAKDADVDALYVDLFWSPTGESRNYKVKEGVFGAVKPKKSLAEGGLGHVMLAARYETFDASDSNITSGGEYEAMLAGVEWRPIDGVAFRLDYGQTDVDFVGTANDATADVVSLRTQFNF